MGLEAMLVAEKTPEYSGVKHGKSTRNGDAPVNIGTPVCDGLLPSMKATIVSLKYN